MRVGIEIYSKFSPGNGGTYARIGHISKDDAGILLCIQKGPKKSLGHYGGDACQLCSRKLHGHWWVDREHVYPTMTKKIEKLRSICNVG